MNESATRRESIAKFLPKKEHDSNREQKKGEQCLRKDGLQKYYFSRSDGQSLEGSSSNKAQALK